MIDFTWSLFGAERMKENYDWIGRYQSRFSELNISLEKVVLDRRKSVCNVIEDVPKIQDPFSLSVSRDDFRSHLPAVNPFLCIERTLCLKAMFEVKSFVKVGIASECACQQAQLFSNILFWNMQRTWRRFHGSFRKQLSQVAFLVQRSWNVGNWNIAIVWTWDFLHTRRRWSRSRLAIDTRNCRIASNWCFWCNKFWCTKKMLSFRPEPSISWGVERWS